MRLLIRFALISLPLSLSLLGCPKGGSTVDDTGTDDERMERYSAKLEELRSRLSAEPPACDDRCKLAKEVCELSAKSCEIASRTAERSDFQSKCVQSREDCAAFNESCASCGG